MAKILIYVLLVASFGFISYALKEKLGKKAFVLFWLLCGGLFIVIIAYELSISRFDKRQEQLLLDFSSGKNLICKDFDSKDFNVSVDKFNYDYGTKSFVSKDKNIRVQIFSVKACKSDEWATKF